MCDENAFSSRYRRPRCLFRPGDAIRVKSGALIHATGVVQRVEGSQRCIITIDGTEPGVCVILDSATLELADPLSC